MEEEAEAGADEAAPGRAAEYRAELRRTAAEAGEPVPERNVRIRPSYANKGGKRASEEELEPPEGMQVPESKKVRTVGGIEVCDEENFEKVISAVVENLGDMDENDYHEINHLSLGDTCRSSRPTSGR